MGRKKKEDQVFSSEVRLHKVGGRQDADAGDDDDEREESKAGESTRICDEISRE